MPGLRNIETGEELSCSTMRGQHMQRGFLQRASCGYASWPSTFLFYLGTVRGGHCERACERSLHSTARWVLGSCSPPLPHPRNRRRLLTARAPRWKRRPRPPQRRRLHSRGTATRSTWGVGDGCVGVFLSVAEGFSWCVEWVAEGNPGGGWFLWGTNCDSGETWVSQGVGHMPGVGGRGGSSPPCLLGDFILLDDGVVIRDEGI